MAIIHQTTELGHVVEEHQKLQSRAKGTRGQWWRFALILVITVIALVPVGVVLLLAFTPSASSTSTGLTTENFQNIFAITDVVLWLQNSLLVTLGTVLVSVVVAAPAGYVLSRGRSRAVSGYSLLLFVVQSLPVITAVIPLFILFANLGLVDNLIGLAIVYVGTSMSVATWMMAAYMDSIPISLEEAAWIDGASVFGASGRSCCATRCPASSRPRSSPSWWPGTTTSSPSCSCARRSPSPCPSACSRSSSRTSPTGAR